MLGRAETEATAAADQDEIRARHLEAAFPVRTVLYATLFEVLGCLTMRWDVWYEPEQGAAFDYPDSAPRDELEAAFRTAAAVGERRGENRVLRGSYSRTSS